MQTVLVRSAYVSLSYIECLEESDYNLIITARRGVLYVRIAGGCGLFLGDRNVVMHNFSADQHSVLVGAYWLFFPSQWWW